LFSSGPFIILPYQKAVKRRCPLINLRGYATFLPYGLKTLPRHPSPDGYGSAVPGAELIARSKERVGNKFYAVGNVEVRYKNLIVFADKAEVDTETKDVFAEGHVSIHMPPREVISMDSIRLNLDSYDWTMEKVSGLVQPSIFYSAETVKRKAVDLFSLDKASITSCSQAVPRWRFSSSRANIKKDDYIEMWNTTVRIKNIPVFYIPYIRFPVDEGRQTGFLTPQIGYSGVKGFFVSQAFYWNIRRNMDATLNVDYYGSRGIGGGLEYRYQFSEGMAGQIRLFFLKFKNVIDVDDPKSAYLVRFNHNQPLPWNFHLVANVDYQSSYDFLREFDNNFKRAVVSNRSSQVYLSRSWSSFNFSMRAARFETYFRDLDLSIIRTSLPEVNLSSAKIKLFDPLYLSFSTRFSAWEYGSKNSFEAGNQRHSQSFDFSPMLTVPFTSIPWLTLTSSLSARFVYHFQSYAPNSRAIVEVPLFQRMYNVNVELVGPVFYRTYYGSDSVPKMKHIIEPTFSYRYDSPVNVSDRIITASSYFFRYHYLSYGIKNSFLVKQNGTPTDIVSFSLNHTFYFEPEESPLQLYKVDGEAPSFSDIRGTVRFYPSSRTYFDCSAAFNPYYKNFSSLRLGMNLGSPADNTFLKINWYKSINPYITNLLYARHQISFYGGLKIPKLSLEAQAQMDFNIQKKELLYSALTLIYHYQCLDFQADVRVFYFRQKPELQFNFSFGLGNIGKTTRFLDGLGF
jgi:LPS-assembly protein